MLTGDIVRFPSKQSWDQVDKDIQNLGIPVYFAVGNHDDGSSELFQSRYGRTYYDFRYQDDLFIVLDPNIDSWNISDDQLNFLKFSLATYKDSVDHIFVFFHQLLWWDADNKYKRVLPNSYQDKADQINFWTSIEPMFHQLSIPVIMFAGDVGAYDWTPAYMYDNYDNITLIASGMGKGVDENFVIVDVKQDQSVEYRLIALLGDDIHTLGALENYRLPASINSIRVIIFFCIGALGIFVLRYLFRTRKV